MTDPEEVVKRMVEGYDAFAEDMKEQNLHVGLGNPARCAACGVPWPCPDSEQMGGAE